MSVPKFKGEGFAHRLCLRCQKDFPSRSRYNRLCEKCRKANHKFSGTNIQENRSTRRGNGTAARDI